jgi:hypothetical protein
MMKVYGISELIFDLQEYPTKDDTSGEGFTWDWNYPATSSLPANTASEAVTRGNVRMCGAQIMTPLLAGYPGITVGVYYMHVPGTHREWVNHVTYHPTIAEPYLETDVGAHAAPYFATSWTASPRWMAMAVFGYSMRGSTSRWALRTGVGIRHTATSPAVGMAE